MVSTKFKRGWLRRVYRLVPATYPTLLAALDAQNDSASLSASSGGGAITQTSANGHSISFAAPSAGTCIYTQQDTAELAAEMRDLYDSAKAALISAGTPAPTDALIYTQMLAELQPAYESTPDFSNLHFARQ